MAHVRRHLTVLLLGSLASIPVARAIPPAAEHTLTFTVFSGEPVDHLSYVPAPGANLQPLVFYPTARSPIFTYTGPSKLQLVDSGRQALVAEVEIPSGIRSALLILSAVRSATDGTRRFHVRVIDDSTLQHGPGELLILNLSGLSLSGTINGRALTLADGINKLVRVAGSAALRLRTPFRNRSYPAYSDIIDVEASGRALLLLLPPWRRGSLEVQSRVLLDHPEPGPEAGNSAAE